MPMIQPEFEYQTQQKLCKLRHEAHVANLTRGPAFRDHAARLLHRMAVRLEHLAQRLTPAAQTAP